MAITKQTAKRSTGGKVLRTEIAVKAARTPRLPRAATPARGEEWITHSWIMFTGEGPAPWMVQPIEPSKDPERYSEGSREIPRYLESWCRLNPKVALDESRCHRWGLLEESDEGERGQVENNDDDEDDDHDDDDDDSEDDEDGSSVEDGEAPKCGPRGRTKPRDDFIVKTIRYNERERLYSGRGDRGRWCPIMFHKLRVCEDDANIMKELNKIDEWCCENRGNPKQLPVGSRPQATTSNQHYTHITVVYQSYKANCVALSAANVVHRCDPATAQLLVQCTQDFSKQISNPVCIRLRRKLWTLS
jgi:hypothetical protein